MTSIADRGSKSLASGRLQETGCEVDSPTCDGVRRGDRLAASGNQSENRFVLSLGASVRRPRLSGVIQFVDGIHEAPGRNFPFSTEFVAMFEASDGHELNYSE